MAFGLDVLVGSVNAALLLLFSCWFATRWLAPAAWIRHVICLLEGGMSRFGQTREETGEGTTDRSPQEVQMPEEVEGAESNEMLSDAMFRDSSTPCDVCFFL